MDFYFNQIKSDHINYKKEILKNYKRESRNCH